MTLTQLCGETEELQLWQQVRELEPQPLRDCDLERCYLVHWKATWVELSDLEACSWLLHEFWLKERIRNDHGQE